MDKPFETSVKCAVSNHLYDGEKTLKGIKSFNCGNKVINKFAKDNLKAKGRSATSAVTVLLDALDENRLVGFYTASAHLLVRDNYPVTGLFGKSPKNVPVIKLDMLGVELSYQKQGFGEELVALAMERTAVLAKVISCYGLYLDADKDAVNFYKKLGFIALDGPDSVYGTTPMFLHLNAILDALKDE